MNFFVNNWAQISFVLLALGYIIKVILESIFKRKEVRYNFFLNNRMKAIETFLSNYSNLESSFQDVFRGYIYESLSAKEIDNIIVPLRYKVTDSLSILQLYTTQNEFTNFSKVYSNLMFLINQSSHLKHDPRMNETEKGNEFSSIVDKYETGNKPLLNSIIQQIQRDISKPPAVPVVPSGFLRQKFVYAINICIVNFGY